MSKSGPSAALRAYGSVRLVYSGACLAGARALVWVVVLHHWRIMRAIARVMSSGRIRTPCWLTHCNVCHNLECSCAVVAHPLGCRVRGSESDWGNYAS